MLDAIAQRVLGVLLEKELAVPDSYPLTEAALLAGCNQKSNRDPAMELEFDDLERALEHLQEPGYAVRITGSRAPKFRQRIDEALGLDAEERAVLAELLLRGPQAPGALKPRVARMGFHTDPDGVLAVLRRLAERQPPLCEKLARQPRERDWRWGHCLGERDEESVPDVPRPTELNPARTSRVTPPDSNPTADSQPPEPPTPPEPEAAPGAETVAALEARVAALEFAIEELRDEVRRLGGG